MRGNLCKGREKLGSEGKGRAGGTAEKVGLRGKVMGVRGDGIEGMCEVG